MIRLGLVAASPVYYQAPLYRRLAADPRIDFTAIFASSSGVRAGELGYGEPVAFDDDALGGYESVFLRRAERSELESSSLLRHRDLDVVSEVLRRRFDVLWLHGYASLTHLLAALAQRLRGRPILLRDEQTLLHPRAWWKRALKRILFATLLRGAYGLAVGVENERWLRAQGIPPERIVRVPYCVEVEPVATTPAEAPVVLFVGRLIPKKQPLVLVEAFRRVRAGRRCSLVFVGSGELEEEIRSADVVDVELAGFLNRSRIAEAYARAAFVVLPSGWDETWGLVVNEAMAFGLPVVVSDRVGCAADLVEDGVTGFVVRSGDVAALADRIAALVDDAELRARMGRAAAVRIAAWSYDAAAAGVLDAVAEAVA